MYAKISASEVRTHDEMQHGKAIAIAMLLSEFSFNQVSPKVTAGASGATVTENVFIAPTKGKVTKATFVMDVVQTGSGNTPTVTLKNLTQDEQIGVTASIALSGTIGNKYELTLDNDHVNFNAGDVLQMQIVNPAGTITVALQGKVQFEWHSVQ